MVSQIYIAELTLNKANYADTEAPFRSRLVNFPCLDGAVPCAPSHGVYLSNLINYVNVPI